MGQGPHAASATSDDDDIDIRRLVVFIAAELNIHALPNLQQHANTTNACKSKAIATDFIAADLPLELDNCVTKSERKKQSLILKGSSSPKMASRGVGRSHRFVIRIAND
jgi:hypothetical protein